MSKRKIVKVDCEQILPRIRKNEWSNAAFSRKVGRYETWLGEVLRGKNLPSPEEAARMCLLLHAEPEEIMLSTGETEEETAKLQADIEMVRKLLDGQKEKQPTTFGELSGPKKAILDLVMPLSDEDAEMVLQIAQIALARKTK